MEAHQSAFPLPDGAIVREDMVDIPNVEPFGPAKIHFRHFSNPTREKSRKRIRILMICGFGATQYGYAAMVASLLARDFLYEIVTYDHRTVGRSECKTKSRMTSSRLAQDALLLLDHLEWSDQICVYGPSMGGMVAQELLLLDPKRFSRCFFGVTAAGSPVRMPLGPGFMSFMLSKFLPPTDAAKAEMLVSKAFSKAFLDRNPKDDPQNRFLPAEAHQFGSYREWFVHWFSPPQEGANSLTWEPFSMSCISCVPTSHYVSAERLRLILQAGTRILVQTCGLDQSMPSKDQYTFLERLGGQSKQVKVLDFPECGHMGATERPEDFWSAFTSFFEND
eukprot:TRINITY_DN2099_c0_g1_i1.p1 TRINITY_DN2099_c0_g1~~TRINITY_DN2099_c0_g1_i1.p1  ORF type:complete len:335 (+),score=33.88 TRINITY_DN2099_c0_g1_i1:113-1117(+)